MYNKNNDLKFDNTTFQNFFTDGHAGPTILTEPGLFRSHVGSNVILPCNISRLGDLVLLWKQGSRIIFAGDIKVRRDERFERGMAQSLVLINLCTNKHFYQAVLFA